MELEVGGLTGAAHGEKSTERLVQRNGNCDRVGQTRAGTVEVRILEPRKGSSCPGFLEPGRMAKKALTAVIELASAMFSVRSEAWTTAPTVTGQAECPV